MLDVGTLTLSAFFIYIVVPLEAIVKIVKGKKDEDPSRVPSEVGQCGCRGEAL